MKGRRRRVPELAGKNRWKARFKRRALAQARRYLGWKVHMVSRGNLCWFDSPSRFPVQLYIRPVLIVLSFRYSWCLPLCKLRVMIGKRPSSSSVSTRWDDSDETAQAIHSLDILRKRVFIVVWSLFLTSLHATRQWFIFLLLYYCVLYHFELKFRWSKLPES